jgi:hypothetical protein
MGIPPHPTSAIREGLRQEKYFQKNALHDHPMTIMGYLSPTTEQQIDNPRSTQFWLPQV